ncbi:MAG: UDP-N-acetylmuramoyl-tripeptide--D-alanyl-D-alanine ligase [Patescibacteria group bacterium]
MKSFLRNVVSSLLIMLSRGILRRYKPQVVMVTGSVGKTSTKDAIAAALSGEFYLRASEKSYNSELGVPLTIIGAKTPWGSFCGWLGVFIEAFCLLILPNHYPKLLVLEVGADHPGDLERILRIATPHIVVVTRLPEMPVHVEAYEGPAEVREEEFAPARALPHGAPLILSADDVYARTMAKGLHTTTISYGYAPDARIHIEAAEFLTDADQIGMKGEVLVEDTVYDIHAPGVLGLQQLYAPAAALAVAGALGISPKQALKGLASYAPPPGRARVLPGKNQSTLIDDTYNASPAAVEEALASFVLIQNVGRKIAVLGDMLELGRYSVAEHERIGELAATSVDVLITVGTRARAMRSTAIAHGLGEAEALSFDTAVEAADALTHLIQKGDVVLIKGSQGVRMERIVEKLLHDPKDATRLARQEGEWKKR